MENRKGKKGVVILGIVALILAAAVAVILWNNRKQTEETSEKESPVTTQEPEVSTQDIVVEDKTEPEEDADEEEQEAIGQEDGEPDQNDGAVKQAEGVFDGFIDSHSVEIQLDSGEYATYLIYDEDLIEEMSKLDDFERISYEYQESTEEGRLPQIISVN